MRGLVPPQTTRFYPPHLPRCHCEERNDEAISIYSLPPPPIGEQPAERDASTLQNVYPRFSGREYPLQGALKRGASTLQNVYPRFGEREYPLQGTSKRGEAHPKMFTPVSVGENIHCKGRLRGAKPLFHIKFPPLQTTYSKTLHNAPFGEGDKGGEGKMEGRD